MKKLNQIGINAKKAFLKLNNLEPKKINKVLDSSEVWLNNIYMINDLFEKLRSITRTSITLPSFSRALESIC